MTGFLERIVLIFLLSIIPLQAEIRNLVIGGDYNFPPYEYLDSTGKATGYNIDLMREIAQTMGWEVQFRLMPWNEVIKSLENRKIDMIQGISYSLKRDSIFDFSTAHLVNYHSIFVRKNTNSVQSLDDLHGREIVVQQDDIMQDFALKNQITEKLFTLPTRFDALKALSAGQFDAALTGRYQSLYLISKYGIKNLKPVGSPVASTNYCFAVIEGNLELKKGLDQALAILKENGKYQEIYDRWFGILEKQQQPVNQKSTPTSTSLPFTLLLILTAVLITYYTTRWKLKKTGKPSINEIFLNNLIDNFPGIIYLKDYQSDPKGRYLIVNRGYSSFLKKDKENLKDKTCFDIYSPDQAQSFWQNDQTIMKAQKASTIQEHLRIDDQQYTFLTSLFPINNSIGETIGIGGISLDITRQQELLELLAHETDRFDLLLNNIENGILVTDINDNIYQSNEPAYKLLNLDMDKINGQQLTCVLPEISNIKNSPMTQKLSEQIIHRQLRGQIRYLSVKYLPVIANDNLITGAIVIIKPAQEIPADKIVQDIPNRPQKSSDSNSEPLIFHKDTDKKLILLLDDESAILNIGKELLSVLGYQVLTSSDGWDAVEIYRQTYQQNTPIDLLIFDLTIPNGLGGKEALQQIQEINPHAKAIVCSGYSNDEIMSQYKRFGFSAVLSKPYTIESLSEVLSLVLE